MPAENEITSSIAADQCKCNISNHCGTCIADCLKSASAGIVCLVAYKCILHRLDAELLLSLIVY